MYTLVGKDITRLLRVKHGVSVRIFRLSPWSSGEGDKPDTMGPHGGEKKTRHTCGDKADRAGLRASGSGGHWRKKWRWAGQRPTRARGGKTEIGQERFRPISRHAPFSFSISLSFLFYFNIANSKLSISLKFHFDLKCNNQTLACNIYIYRAVITGALGSNS